MTEHEIESGARYFIRRVLKRGGDAYHCWRISERMLELSLNPGENTDLFPTKPNLANNR